MADHFIGINRGQGSTGDAVFTVGTSTGSTDVEVRIADAAGWTRGELERVLDGIGEYLVTKALFPVT